MDRLGRPRGELYFGLDVWGRGQYGGGGFDTWVSMDAIEAWPSTNKPEPTGYPPRYSPNPPAPPPPTIPSERLGLSTAMFGPAWTVESEHLKHTLSTLTGYQAWLADELYLWTGSPATSNVERERLRRDQERRDERAVRHVRGLANSLAAPRNTLMSILPPKFDYNAPLPPLPGVFRPINSYHPTRPPQLTSRGGFFTNFGLGSGHAFFLDGRKVHESDTGWTDVGLTFPAPALAYEQLARPKAGISVALTEKEAWLGAQALWIECEAGSGAGTVKGAFVPICRTAVTLRPGEQVRASVVWRDSTSAVLTLECVGAGGGKLEVGPMMTTAVVEDRLSSWRRTECLLSCVGEEEVVVETIGARVSAATQPAMHVTTVIVGALALVPVQTANLSDLGITGLSVSPDRAWLRWHLPAESPPSLFLFHSVWLLPAKKGYDEATLLGTTCATEFALPATLPAGCKLVVKRVRDDGTLESWEDAVAVQPGAR